MDIGESRITNSQCTNDPLVSVIVPFYNVGRYLPQCLNSIQAQKYSRFEVILIDDGSTDASSSICSDFCERDRRFHLYHKENGGASSARNAGLEHAQGEYVYFLDSDDYIVPETLEKAVSCAGENRADLVFFEADILNEQGIISTGQYDYHRQYMPDEPYRLMEEMTKHKEFHVSIPLLFVKKELFDSNGLRFREGIISEDMIMAYQLFSLAKRGAHLHEHLYVRRFRPNSVTTTAKTEINYVSAATVYMTVSAFRKTLPAEKQTSGHPIRCAFHVLNIYRQMPKQIQTKYKTRQKNIIEDILKNNAFGDKALALDCKNHLFWYAYKLKQKALRITQ